MKKFIFLAMVAIMVSGCILSEKPSVCDNLDQPSVLCEISGKTGTNLETIGTLLIIGNAVAIGEGVYSPQEAIDVLNLMKDSLDNGVTYTLFKDQVYKYVSKYPGMFIIASAYFSEFKSVDVIYPYDKALLKSWLSQRVEDMENIK